MSLLKLAGKKKLTVLGLSSGTSMDGIDVAGGKISGKKNLKIKHLSFSVLKYPPEVRKRVLDLSTSESYSVEKISRLNFYLGELMAESALRINRRNKLKVDLIGSHGQTIRHLPEFKKFLGKKTRGTWQIGDGDVIAKRTGIVTVCDFRAGDVALSGQGAPLTPYVNYLLFGNRKATAILNIGGIANLSAWPKQGKPEQIIGFDCGPGNMAVDRLMQRFYRQLYDREGRVALAGRVSEKLLSELKHHQFFRLRPPKSTGREEFGEELVKKVLGWSKKYRVEKKDVITTVSELTVQAIWDSYCRFILPKFKIAELLVSGGGRFNRYFVQRLKDLFWPVEIYFAEEKGFGSKALEAVSFAVLAYLALKNLTGNLPGVTGAKRKTILGKICMP